MKRYLLSLFIVVSFTSNAQTSRIIDIKVPSGMSGLTTVADENAFLQQNETKKFSSMLVGSSMVRYSNSHNYLISKPAFISYQIDSIYWQSSFVSYNYYAALSITASNAPLGNYVMKIFFGFSSLGSSSDAMIDTLTINMTIYDASLPPSTAPTLYQPTSGAVDQSTSISFSWSQTPNTSNYSLQVSTQSDFSTVWKDTSNIPVTYLNSVPGFMNATKYYWRIKSVNSHGSSNWSTVGNFTVRNLQPPDLYSPLDSAFGISPSVTFLWAKAQDADSTTLQAATQLNFNSPYITKQNLKYNYFDTVFTNGTTYYWRMRSVNSSGASTWSAVRRFTIRAIPAPTLISPTDGATGVNSSITFQWTTSPDAQSTHLQISLQPDFISIFLDKSNLKNNYFDTSGFTSGMTYYWRIRGENSSGVSVWSASRSFTIAGVAAPVLTEPSDSATGKSLSITFQWSKSANALAYNLQISTASDFSSYTINRSNIQSTSFDTSGFLNGTKYYWRVKAFSPTASSDWSSTKSFTTRPLFPPTLLVPVDGATNVKIPVHLQWSRADDVESYTLQFSTASDFGSVLFSRNMLSTESFDTTGVAASTKYYWRVRTVNRGILSPWSAAFSYTTQSSVDVKEETVIPLMFMIEQNYPNPFNPSTIIHYAIPTRSHVRLQIYNTLGLLVSELVNGDQNAGYQSIVWNATVASGLYFYRIEASEVGNPANRFIETKKMILLK